VGFVEAVAVAVAPTAIRGDAVALGRGSASAAGTTTITASARITNEATTIRQIAAGERRFKYFLRVA
jgi:hypothetical protein